MKKIRILIAEDHKLIRETWTFLLNSDARFAVIATCHDSSDAVTTSHKENPDIVLMDINIRPINGFQATERIMLVAPESKVIGLSFHNELSIVHKMFASGARGYVTKNSGREEIEEAIVRVHGGDHYVCREVAEAGFQMSNPMQKPQNRLDLLTKKEMQVALLIKEGLRSKDISAKMDISVRTVEAHRNHILTKLSLKSSLALINLMMVSENKPEYFG